MARECGREREGTIGRLSVPATRTAGPEGCKTTGLRGGRDTETETERNTNKARPSRVPAAAAAAAVHRGYNLPSSLRPSPECVSSPTTVLGCLRPPVSRLQAAPPCPAPPRPIVLPRLNPRLPACDRGRPARQVRGGKSTLAVGPASPGK